MKRVFVFLFITFLFNSCSSSDETDSTDDNISIENPALKVTAMASVIDEGNGINGIDDIIEYTISIHNTGDVTLSNISLTSSLNDFLDNPLTLAVAPNFVSATLGSTMGSIQADEIATYNANFTITQSEVDADGLQYSVTVNAITPQNISVSDVSDNGDDLDGNLENDPTETNIEFDPLIISEYHILNIDGDIILKYYFDDDGMFYKYSNIIQNISTVFNYDSQGRITTVDEIDLLDNTLSTHQVVYTSNGKIASIDDHNYIYNADENFYYDEATYYESVIDYGDLIYTEIQYLKFYYSDNPINLITQECSYAYESFYDTVNDTNTENIYCSPNLFSGACFIGYDGINVNSDYCDGWSNFEYFTSTNNPLYSDMNNLNTLYTFIRRLDILDWRFEYNLLWSQNILHTDITSDAPDVYTYEYNYNSLNLPIETTRYYSEGPTVYPDYISAKYYYQGDVIPD
jgi:uncharacterized repeat protein (TIGR01451 family)|nr:hypothetical protein [uncultured Psychroserpens sp.]